MTHAPSGRPPLLFADLSLGWGGDQQWHLTMAAALAERGWPVEIAAHPAGALAQRAAAAGAAVWPLALRPASLLNPFQVRGLLRGLAARRPGAVILGAPRDLATVGLAAWRQGVPRVLYRHAAHRPVPAGVAYRLVLGRAMTDLVADSHAALAGLTRVLPGAVEPLRMAVIYPGVDPRRWEPRAARVATGRIAVVAPLEWEQGVDRAVQALHLLRRRMGHAALRIVGAGSQRRNLEVLAEELGVAGAVEFAAETADRTALLADCDVLAVPARAEGVGTAWVEAMLLELPVVAFDLAAAREVLLDGVTGLLAPEGDIDALAGALGAILGAPAQARKMGMAGRLRALSNYSLEREVGQWERMLLDGAAPPGA